VTTAICSGQWVPKSPARGDSTCAAHQSSPARLLPPLEKSPLMFLKAFANKLKKMIVCFRIYRRGRL